MVLHTYMGQATVLSRGRKQASSPELTNSNDSQDKGYWTLVSGQSRRRSLPLASEVPLHDRYGLGLERGDYVSNGKDLGKASESI